MDFQQKECYTIGDLEHIIALLRAPGGCPWDIEQTHQSVRANLIEETWTKLLKQSTPIIWNFSRKNWANVLMQVLFHAQMEAEQGTFTFADVVDGVAKKLIVRHPHVFGNVQVTDSAQVLSNWDEIKKRQNPKQHKQRCLRVFLLHYLPLCAVIRLQKKAAKVGVDVSGRKCSLELNNCSCAGIKTDIVKTARQ